VPTETASWTLKDGETIYIKAWAPEAQAYLTRIKTMYPEPMNVFVAAVANPPMMEGLSVGIANDKADLEWTPAEKKIFVMDRTDKYNLPAAYNKTKRGLRPAVDKLIWGWSPMTTMHDILEAMGAANVRMHYYCMMD